MATSIPIGSLVEDRTEETKPVDREKVRKQNINGENFLNLIFKLLTLT